MVAWREFENPFEPGWGDEPPHFAGRHAVFHEILSGLRRGASSSRFHHVIVGGPGTGKTVLLNHIEGHVRDEWDWPVIMWSGFDDWTLRELMNEEGPRVARELVGAVRSMKPNTLSTSKVPGVGAATKELKDPDRARSVTGWMTHLGELARDRNRTVLLSVDELQNIASPDVEALSGALQVVTKRKRLPVAVVGAGLPYAFKVMRDAQGRPTPFFVERQNSHMLGNLPREEALEAIVRPLADRGRDISAEALDSLLDATSGYPFAVQLAGEAAWDLAGNADEITRQHAVEAIEVMNARLARQLYSARWDDLSDADQRYVAAAARLAVDGQVVSGDVARALGKDTSDVSVTRQGLINDHHLLYMVKHNVLGFTVPGFDKWVRDAVGGIGASQQLD